MRPFIVCVAIIAKSVENGVDYGPIFEFGKNVMMMRFYARFNGESGGNMGEKNTSKTMPLEAIMENGFFSPRQICVRRGWVRKTFAIEPIQISKLKAQGD